jgi:hypothetical protein
LSIINPSKLKGFLVSFSAVNPCETRNDKKQGVGKTDNPELKIL